MINVVDYEPPDNDPKNVEGMTWPEWAYAAGVREPHIRGIGLSVDGLFHGASHHWRGYRDRFPKERKAWKAGEDPSEWRAAAKGHVWDRPR